MTHVVTQSCRGAMWSSAVKQRLSPHMPKARGSRKQVLTVLG